MLGLIFETRGFCRLILIKLNIVIDEERILLRFYFDDGRLFFWFGFNDLNVFSNVLEKIVEGWTGVSNALRNSFLVLTFWLQIII